MTGRVGVMITNGADHSPDLWAETTAGCIVEISDHIAAERRGPAIKLQAAIYDVLHRHHTEVADNERVGLQSDGHGRLATPLQHDREMDDVLAEVTQCAVGTPWEEDFKTEEFQINLRHLLDRHFNTQVYNARSWHADANMEQPEAQEFRATYHPGTPAPAAPGEA